MSARALALAGVSLLSLFAGLLWVHAAPGAVPCHGMTQAQASALCVGIAAWHCVAGLLIGFASLMRGA